VVIIDLAVGGANGDAGLKGDARGALERLDATAILYRAASIRLPTLLIRLSHGGVIASSKLAVKTCVPKLSALMI
jgi:hypothetical protein